MNRKNILFCLAWIVPALVLFFLLWFFTQPFRTRLLIETVNKTLAVNGGGRLEIQDGSSLNPASILGGAWFTVANSSDSAFVFTIMRNGVAGACVALLDSGGKVKTIAPLGGNALQISGELPLPVYRFYVDRIERSAKKRNKTGSNITGEAIR